jgi:hypothetical protein
LSPTLIVFTFPSTSNVLESETTPFATAVGILFVGMSVVICISLSVLNAEENEGFAEASGPLN